MINNNIDDIRKDSFIPYLCLKDNFKKSEKTTIFKMKNSNY